MPRYFKFMTGANHYRCEAASREEAIHIAFTSLNPSDDVKDLILSTLYEEGDEAFLQTAISSEPSE